jgi:hypothetical protein
MASSQGREQASHLIDRSPLMNLVKGTRSPFLT